MSSNSSLSVGSHISFTALQPDVEGKFFDLNKVLNDIWVGIIKQSSLTDLSRLSLVSRKFHYLVYQFSILKIPGILKRIFMPEVKVHTITCAINEQKDLSLRVHHVKFSNSTHDIQSFYSKRLEIKYESSGGHAWKATNIDGKYFENSDCIIIDIFQIAFNKKEETKRLISSGSHEHYLEVSLYKTGIKITIKNEHLDSEIKACLQVAEQQINAIMDKEIQKMEKIGCFQTFRQKGTKTTRT